MILQEEPHITVGIQHGKSVDFRLCGIFTTPEGRLFPPGEYRVEISTEVLFWERSIMKIYASFH